MAPIMNDRHAIDTFIEPRAMGWTYSRITPQLNVSKNTTAKAKTVDLDTGRTDNRSRNGPVLVQK